MPVKLKGKKATPKGSLFSYSVTRLWLNDACLDELRPDDSSYPITK